MPERLEALREDLPPLSIKPIHLTILPLFGIISKCYADLQYDRKPTPTTASRSGGSCNGLLPEVCATIDVEGSREGADSFIRFHAPGFRSSRRIQGRSCARSGRAFRRRRAPTHHESNFSPSFFHWAMGRGAATTNNIRFFPNLYPKRLPFHNYRMRMKLTLSRLSRR